MEKKQLSISDIGLIRKIAWGFCKTSRLDYNDLFQEACLAYLKSLESYNPEKGALSTYMWRCISNHLTNYLKLEQKQPFGTPIEEFAEEFASSASNYFEKLPEDALTVAKVVLHTPKVFAIRTHDDVVSLLKDVMEQKGWPRSKTVAAINVLHAIYS